jgi:hypothetical protein
MLYLPRQKVNTGRNNSTANPAQPSSDAGSVAPKSLQQLSSGWWSLAKISKRLIAVSIVFTTVVAGTHLPVAATSEIPAATPNILATARTTASSDCSNQKGPRDCSGTETTTPLRNSSATALSNAVDSNAVDSNVADSPKITSASATTTLQKRLPVCTETSTTLCLGHNKQVTVTVTQGATRSLSPDFFGYNISQTTAAASNNPSFVPAHNVTNPETLRGIIGGTPANYWNWQTGKYFIQSNDATLSYINPNEPSPSFSLNSYVTDLKESSADGVFNLNVMTYCPTNNNAPTSTTQAGTSCSEAQACGPNPSQYTNSCTNTDYTWGLAYQIAMLQTAQSLGIPIKYIELGNEFYLTDNPDNVYYFPSVTAYINKVNAWIPILKQDFPSAEIGVVGADGDAANTEAAWNQAVATGVAGENAITFHPYFGSVIPSGGSVENPNDMATMLSESSEDGLGALQKYDLSYLPSGVSGWITEWNLSPSSTTLESGSWAQGLSEANFAVGLARMPQVTLTDVHDLISTQVFGAIFAGSQGYVSTLEGEALPAPSPLPTTQAFGMTGGGFALSALERSLHGATSTTALNFANTSVSELTGQSFMVGGRTNLYFVNLGPSALTLDLGELAGSYAELQYASNPTIFVTGDNSIPTFTSTVSNTVTIPGYSVTSLISN